MMNVETKIVFRDRSTRGSQLVCRLGRSLQRGQQHKNECRPYALSVCDTCSMHILMTTQYVKRVNITLCKPLNTNAGSCRRGSAIRITILLPEGCTDIS